MTEIGKIWTLGGIQIAVEEDSLDYPAIRMARLGPLEYNYTIGHYGGTEASYREIQFVIFSGYEENILPLVGSGYWTLVPDVGLTGQYFITSVRAERLHANNRPSPVFRVSAQLRRLRSTQRVRDVTITFG